jgi:hypothetical protein
MGRSQENVSRIERRHDVRISTLIGLVRALGGELEITAVFPDRRVSLLRVRRAKRSPRGMTRGGCFVRKDW